MEAVYFVVAILLFYAGVAVGRPAKGSCFQFNGDGRVEFAYSQDIASEAHFSLKFKTSASEGVLYYAGGTYNRQRVFDYEGLYIDNGILYYFLYNPGVYSIGSSSGFFGASKVKVNDGRWHKAEFTRNIQVAGPGVYQTALILDGEIQASDSHKKTGVSIYQPITLGADPHEDDRNNPFQGFKGSIKGFRDVLKKRYLVDGQTKGHVTHCIDVPDAQ